MACEHETGAASYEATVFANGLQGVVMARMLFIELKATLLMIVPRLKLIATSPPP